MSVLVDSQYFVRKWESTGDIELEDFKSLAIDVKAIEDAFLGAREICSGGCDHRQVGGLKQAPGKLKADAARGGGCEDPWLGHHGRW